MYLKGQMDIFTVVILCLAILVLDITKIANAKALDIDDNELFESLEEVGSDEIAATLDEVKLPSTEPFLPDHFSLSFSYNGSELTLIVLNPIKFLRNHIMVEQQKDDIMTEKLLSTDCFFTGYVLEWEGSTASVDVCTNFRSIIVYNGQDIVIDKAELKDEKDDIKDEAFNLKFFGEEHAAKSRQKRQLSNMGEMYMEVLIVTDSSVADFHGKDILEQYLITQMNIVNNVYHHSSLGVEINIVVVKIVVVDDSTANRFVVRGSGKKTLDNFCQWAAAYQPQDANHDIALYITRHDIGPAGYAPVTGMCNPKRSCAVQKDAGVSSAYVIAHEIGHVIGMGHDGYGNECSSEPDDGKVMAATVQANFAKFYWTSCSRRALMQHIGGLYCLNNKPGDQNWPEYSQPFGLTWTLDEQCRQEFGDGYKACRVFEQLDLCNTLWCAKASEPMLCKTKRGPPLPGTECGFNQWCMDGRCTAKKSVSVDGGWSSWTEWSSCSQTCGISAQTRLRKCNNPSPEHGGRKCSGDSEEVKLCKLQECEAVTDQRAELCSEYDNTHYHGNRWHTWTPTENDKVDDQCKLSCISIETGDTLVTDSDVPDGTKCSYDKPHDICVRGSCISVGCDGVMGSNKYDDRCGVCGGDGTSCKVVDGTFHEELPRKEYHKVLILPAQARDIVVRENPSHSYLAHFFAVKTESGSDMYLNSRRRQKSSRQFVIEGAKFRYNARGPETLTARGPLLGNVEVMVYSLSSRYPCSITFEYNIPKALENTVTTEIAAVRYEYKWREKGWSECSVSCDGGIRSSVFECFEEVHEKVVEDDLCSEADEPTIVTEECGMDPCFTHTYEWRPKTWSPCSRTCGKGGIELRAVICMTINLYGTKMNWQVPQEKCEDMERPASMKSCNTEIPCPSKWKLGQWSECSASCGSGTQSRTVSCGPIADSAEEYHCDGEQPPDTRICEVTKCPDPTTTTSTTTTTTTPKPTTTTTTPTPTTTTPAPTKPTTTPSTTSTTEKATTKAASRTAKWWETPTPKPTKKSRRYRKKDNSVELNDKQQELNIPNYPPVNPGSGWGGPQTEKPKASSLRRHHRHHHEYENSGDIDDKSLLREKYHGNNNEITDDDRQEIKKTLETIHNGEIDKSLLRDRYHGNNNEITDDDRKEMKKTLETIHDAQKPEVKPTAIATPSPSGKDEMSTLTNRHSMFSVLSERHNSRHNSRHHRKLTTTSTTTPKPTTVKPEFMRCPKDKSFFCRMSLNVEKCHIAVYAKFCCSSCAKILNAL